MVYLDASALVKLFRAEPESAALRRYLAGGTGLGSAEILHVEAVCVARRLGARFLAGAHAALVRVDLIPLSAHVRDLATAPHRPGLAALDAIHLGTALSIRERLDALVTYDRSLARAAAAHGLPVAAPA